MEPAIHGPHRNVRMGMVGGAAHNGVEILLLETASPIHVGPGPGELLQGVGETRFVDIAESDDVLIFQSGVMSKAAAPHSDQGDVKFLVRGILAEERSGRKDQ